MRNRRWRARNSAVPRGTSSVAPCSRARWNREGHHRSGAGQLSCAHQPTPDMADLAENIRTLLALETSHDTRMRLGGNLFDMRTHHRGPRARMALLAHTVVSAPPTASASKGSNNDWPPHTVRSCTCNALSSHTAQGCDSTLRAAELTIQSAIPEHCAPPHPREDHSFPKPWQSTPQGRPGVRRRARQGRSR